MIIYVQKRWYTKACTIGFQSSQMIHYCWIECVLVTANKAAEGRSVLEYDDVMQFAVLCPPTKYLNIWCRGSCEERNLIRASHQLITEPHEHRHRWQYLHKTFRGYKVGVYLFIMSLGLVTNIFFIKYLTLWNLVHVLILISIMI